MWPLQKCEITVSISMKVIHKMLFYIGNTKCYFIYIYKFSDDFVNINSDKLYFNYIQCAIVLCYVWICTWIELTNIIFN